MLRAGAVAECIQGALAQVKTDMTALQNEVNNLSGIDDDWKNLLDSLLKLLYQHSDAKVLGNYALIHRPLSAVEQILLHGQSPPPQFAPCCRQVYREYLHYVTPMGDCLSMPPAIGGITNTVVEPTGDSYYQGQYPPGSPLAENKSPSRTFNHTVVYNCDLGLRMLHYMFSIHISLEFIVYGMAHLFANLYVQPQRR